MASTQFKTRIANEEKLLREAIRSSSRIKVAAQDAANVSTSYISGMDADTCAAIDLDRSIVRLDSFWNRYGKRSFDLVFSLVFMLTLGWWLLPAIALAIKLDSPGPVLFRQKRVGLDGQLFTCLKFRSMRHVANNSFVQAVKNDSRITRVGAFLRKTNLDELPQFLNVLGGSMSVVGPRPHVPELDAEFIYQIPEYRVRHLMKPGVTGMAQVSGCRGSTRTVREMKHRIRFDCFYLHRQGLWMDISVVFRTVKSMLGGDSHAY